jgi:hypothetical protein
LILTLPVPGLLSIGFAASTNLILWHSLLLCLQISKLNPQFSFVHNEFLAVEAVIGEPVSALSFPVSRENTGKFWRRRPRTAILASPLRWKFNGLPVNSLELKTGKFPA